MIDNKYFLQMFGSICCFLTFINIILVMLILPIKAEDSWSVSRNFQVGKSLAKSYHYFGDIYIKLYIFYDQSLLGRFANDTVRLTRFIYAITNSVSLSYNNQPLNRLARFYFVVLAISQIDSSIRFDPLADGENYRQAFRKFYFKKLRPYLTILLTGYNFRYKRNRTDTQGLASLGFIACNKLADPYIIIEARSFRAAFIMAHEIGHTMNMQHDEENQVNDHQEQECSGNFIMSMTTGPGKTKFSICSYYQLKRYFMLMDDNIRHCFQELPPRPLAIFPWRQKFMAPKIAIRFTLHSFDPSSLSISLTEQCQMALGKTFRWKMEQQNHKLTKPIANVNVCSRIECTNHVVTIFIDPAIENTTCATGRYCRGGKCL